MSESVVRDKVEAKLFAKRLTEACDASPNVPEYGKGRQVVIADKLNVSQEAVRKYFTGDSMPKPDRMGKLAAYLEVEKAWLALGEKSEITHNAKKVAGRIADAAVMFTAGTIQLAGGNCSFPSEEASRGGIIDIVTIIKGVSYNINVSSGQERSPNVFELIVPHDFKDLRCIACIVWGTGVFDLIELPTALIERHKVRRSIDFSITVNRIAGRYFTGDDEWEKFNPLGGNS